MEYLDIKDFFDRRSLLSLLLFVLSLSWGHSHALITEADVYLDSITLLTSHSVLFTPRVFFQCKDEEASKKVEVSGVNKVGMSYVFMGNETWQPILRLNYSECKHCGFYQHLDAWFSDATFAEWDICAEDFVSPNALSRSTSLLLSKEKEKEIKSTLSCPECAEMQDDLSRYDSNDNDSRLPEPSNLSVLFLVLLLLLFPFAVAFPLRLCIEYEKKKKQGREKRREESETFLEMSSREQMRASDDAFVLEDEEDEDEEERGGKRAVGEGGDIELGEGSMERRKHSRREEGDEEADDVGLLSK